VDERRLALTSPGFGLIVSFGSTAIEPAAWSCSAVTGAVVVLPTVIAPSPARRS
jgi:hypothetical protein